MTAAALLALSLAARGGVELQAFVSWWEARGAYAEAAPAGCRVWDPRPAEGEVATWSGACDDQGYAKGEGTITWRREGVPVRTAAGTFDGGFLGGQGVTSAACPGTAKRWFTYRGDHWLGLFDGVGQATFCDGTARWFVMGQSLPVMACPSARVCAAGDAFDADAAAFYVLQLRLPPAACARRFPEQAARWKEALVQAAARTSRFLPRSFWTGLPDSGAGLPRLPDLSADECLEDLRVFASPRIGDLAKVEVIENAMSATAHCLRAYEDLGERYRGKAIAAVLEAAPLLGPAAEQAILAPPGAPGGSSHDRCEALVRALDTPWPRLALSDEGIRRALVAASRAGWDMRGGAGKGRHLGPGMPGGDLKSAVGNMFGPVVGDTDAEGGPGSRGADSGLQGLPEPAPAAGE